MSIFDRVRDCTVRISEIGDKGRTGTGFFVAPGCVLTCAHVIEPSPNGQPGEFNIESQFGHWRSTPEAWRPASHSDIALLSITSTAHPCVLFGATAEPRDPVWSQGFIDRQGEVRLEPFIGEIEGERRARLQVGGPEYTLIKFKGARVVPGMSGAPLLNQNSGLICGIVARTLNDASEAGGLAVPVRTILGGLPLLAERQSAYHALHQDWRLSEIVFPNPELGLEDKIRALRRLPPGPAVSITIVPDELVSRFYAITFTDSTDMVRRANALRARADPSVKPRLIILYPPAADKGIIDFWLAAFGSAAGRGPRMLAALLYEAPPGTFEGIEDEVRSLLASLKTWPIA